MNISKYKFSIKNIKKILLYGAIIIFVIILLIFVIWMLQKINHISQIESFENLDPSQLPTYNPEIHKNIIIPFVAEGLGNQLYFISQAYVYAKRFSKTLYLKYETQLHGYGKPRPTYFTSVFRNIPILKIDNEICEKFTHVSESELDIDKPGDIFMTGGYYQKPAILVPYLDDIRDLFESPPETAAKVDNIIEEHKININQDIFLHIRLGDDWTPSDFGNVYTPDEIDKIQEFILTELDRNPGIKCILFSNNVDKSLELLGPNEKLLSAIQPMKYDEITDIYLMARGRRFIASPSTFMIWGIMLSNHPDKEINILWSTDSTDYRRDFYSQYSPLLNNKIPSNYQGSSNEFTCVSCFYNIGKSKYNTEAYTKWFANTLNIDANYVIFTDSASLELIKPYREDRNTKYVIKPLNDFTIKSDNLDAKQHIHEMHVPSIDVGLIWLNKLEMVKIASEINEFGSNWFIWMDAGLASLRDVKQTTNQPFRFDKLDFQKFNPEKIYYGESEPNEITSGVWEYKHNVQGTFFIIHKSSIFRFYQLFQDYFNRCISQVNNYICLSDQIIWSHIKVDNPDIFEKICDGYGCIVNATNLE